MQLRAPYPYKGIKKRDVVIYVPSLFLLSVVQRGSVIHVPPSFLLSVNLRTNLPIGPVVTSLSSDMSIPIVVLLRYGGSGP